VSPSPKTLNLHLPEKVSTCAHRVLRSHVKFYVRTFAREVLKTSRDDCYGPP